jgi:hypothetical protein
MQAVEQSANGVPKGCPEAPKVKRPAISKIVAFVASRTLIVKLIIEPRFFPVRQ